MQRVIGFGVVFFTLVLFADFEPTQEVAVAFAYLVLLSTLLVVGPVAFGRIETLVNGPTLPHTASFDKAHSATG